MPSVSPVEELRWLEYGQRLMSHRRAVLAGRARHATGRHLFDAAVAGGAAACGAGKPGLATGCMADIVVLDTEHPLLVARSGDALLDSWIFAGNAPLVRHVVAGGRVAVRDGHHRDEKPIARRFAAAMQSLAT